MPWRPGRRHAECGDFDQAVKRQEQALALYQRITRRLRPASLDWRRMKDKKPYRE